MHLLFLQLHSVSCAVAAVAAAAAAAAAVAANTMVFLTVLEVFGTRDSGGAAAACRGVW